MSQDPQEALQQNLQFASYGRTWMIVLRGSWGRAVDQFVTKWTGISLISLQYALAGGRPYTPSLLFTTIGRRTGRLHTVVLPYVVDGDSIVVIGSRAGGPYDPHWAHNVRADGRCWIRVARHEVPADAHVAMGEERERVFKVVADKKPNIPRYQERASTFGREIPLVVIEPRQPVRLSRRA
jgi:deazaflavin-dependent oxidoreductase (nitroreductase family)